MGYARYLRANTTPPIEAALPVSRGEIMIILGFIMAIIGYWLFPEFLPEVPLRIDNLIGVVGVILIIIGLILLVLSLAGRPVGNRKYWY